ncbi:hypothetical protein EXIGLDRAFT_753145 [Exidia glandulosa HHB12029]|uniref:N-acetyltransferase domain-containing protein n=1 Tax=Exidia glandulosa HHB12029 TaxID=1314781 RepID=A0A165DZ90_EXIGL|nr:hypothetical protein EXIGLDRAFT_753145 [Exidia glandulosa HHB12029]
MYEVSQLKAPTSEELEGMVDVLLLAFGGRYFFADKENSRALMKTQFNDALVAETGEIYVARNNATGEIVGAAVWFGPGSKFLATAAQRAAGWDELYGSLSKDAQEWWDYFIATFDGYIDKAFGSGVKLAGYHLQVIGVHPEHRRKGIARQFFEVVEVKAKEEGVCTCIETIGTGALPAYRGLGYEVKEPGTLRSSTDPTRIMPLYGMIKVFN